MKKILKIGDQTYTQSLQHFSQSYLTGFPQREQFLMEHVKRVEFVFFRHKMLNDLEDVYKEQQRLKDYLKNQHFDFLMIDNPLSSLLVNVDCSVPVLFDSIDWYSEMYLREFGIDKRYYLLRYGLLRLLQIAERVVCQSPLNLNALKKRGLKTKKTVVIPNGYDARFFYPYTSLRIKRLRKFFSEKYHLDLNERKIIVYTGKVGKWYKNIKVIANAIEADQVFFIVGDGPLLEEIPNKKNILKCGAVDFTKVPDYTNIADVLVFPVDNDCSPLAVSEYCAVGRPIVMGKGRIEWLLINGKSGFLVENNVSSWKKGIKEALRIKKISRRYNLLLSKNLSWQKLATQRNLILHQSTLERYNPVTKYIKSNIAFWNIKSIESYRFGPKPRWNYTSDPKYDLGIHDVDLWFYLTRREITWQLYYGYGKQRREIIFYLNDGKIIVADLLNKFVVFEGWIIKFDKVNQSSPITEMINNIMKKKTAVNEQWSKEIEILEETHDRNSILLR